MKRDKKNKIEHPPLTGYAAKRWYKYIIMLVCLLLDTGLAAVTPLITKHIVDDVILGGQLQLAIRLLIGILICGAGRAVFGYVKELTSDSIGIGIGEDMRRDLYAHIQSLDVGFFYKNNTGELMSRITDDVSNVCFVLGFLGMLILEALAHSVITIVCMVRINPLLTVIPLLIIIGGGIIALRMEKKLDEGFDSLSEEKADMNTTAQENLSGVRTVKAFSREEHEIEKFRKHNEKYYDIAVGINRAYINHFPWITFLSKIMLILVITVGGLMVIFNDGSEGFAKALAACGSAGLTLGGLTAFFQYANDMIWPMECFGWLANSVAAAFASNRKINNIYEQKPAIVSPEHPKTLEKVEGSIEFDNVSFAVGEKTILENVSFKLEKGKTLGIMGVTGSGKSTIVNLVERFYDATGGAVRLDGVDVRELPLDTVRSATAVVMQDVFLFSDSIKENITMGRKSAIDQKEMESAADAAQASEFIDALENRYETIIGERGVGLSGGQKQRISIARAISKRCPILVLDDSTSALDMETEYQFQQALAGLGETTKIVIAHRISAVKDADEIIILDGGRVAERGTHRQLMEKRGLYFGVYVAQYNTETDMTGRSEAV